MAARETTLAISIDICTMCDIYDVAVYNCSRAATDRKYYKNVSDDDNQLIDSSICFGVLGMDLNCSLYWTSPRTTDDSCDPSSSLSDLYLSPRRLR